MDEEAPSVLTTEPQAMMAPASPEERPLQPTREESLLARDTGGVYLETFDDFLEALEERGAEFLFYTRHRRLAFLGDEAEAPDDTPPTPGSVVRGFLVFRFASREDAGAAHEATRRFHGPGVGYTELHSAELLLLEPEKARLIVPYHMRH